MRLQRQFSQIDIHSPVIIREIIPSNMPRIMSAAIIIRVIISDIRDYGPVYTGRTVAALNLDDVISGVFSGMGIVFPDLRGIDLRGSGKTS